MTPKTTVQPLPQLPTDVPSPPVFGAMPQGTRPKPKSTQATFLGAQDLPSPGNLGGKKLIGD